MCTVDTPSGRARTPLKSRREAAATLRGGCGTPAGSLKSKPPAPRSPTSERQMVLGEARGQGGPEEVRSKTRARTAIAEPGWGGGGQGRRPSRRWLVSNSHACRRPRIPRYGATEFWEVANLTEDAHPSTSLRRPVPVINRRTWSSGQRQRTHLSRAWDATFQGGYLQRRDVRGRHSPSGYGPQNDTPRQTPTVALGGISLRRRGFLMAGNDSRRDCQRGGWKDTIKMLPKDR